MRILLVVDYSAAADRALKEFADRKWPPGSIVRVLSVVENVPPSAAELWFGAGGSLKAVMNARQANSEELVAKAAGLLGTKDLITETAVRLGRPRKVIAEEAKSWSADLVIIASHGMADVKRIEGNSPAPTD